MTDTKQTERQRFATQLHAAWSERKPVSADVARDESYAIYRSRRWDNLSAAVAAGVAYVAYKEVRE